MKRVLFLAYLFPPIANSGTQRPLKFAKYLADYGWEPTVITAANFEHHAIDQGLAADLPPNVRVVRVPLLNEALSAKLATLGGNRAFGRKIGDALSWRLQRHWRTPDLYALWKPTVLRAARKIFDEDGFDVILSTGFPWTSLLIGRELAQATGRPFVPDFRDLWAGDNMFRSERPSHDEEHALERSVVESATAVVSASASIGRYLATVHPHVDEDKFVAIHNGFDAADFAGSAPPSHGSKFRIVFTGVWKEGYNPGDLYDSIDWIRRSNPSFLDGCEVIAAGFKPGEADRRGLSAYIDERGIVSHDEAVALMRSADLLYLSHVDPDRQWAVPGKLYEYLASGIPVLALTDPAKETAKILERVGGGIALSPEDPGTLYRALADACRAKKLDVPPRNAEALASFERRHLTAKLAAVLDDVSSGVHIHHTALRMGGDASAMLATRIS